MSYYLLTNKLLFIYKIYKNFLTILSEERLVNLAKGGECFVGSIYMFLVYVPVEEQQVVVGDLVQQLAVAALRAAAHLVQAHVLPQHVDVNLDHREGETHVDPHCPKGNRLSAI